jgi:catalase
MADKKKLTDNTGSPVGDNQNVLTTGPRWPMLLQDVWFLEKLAHFDREVIPERCMHAKGSGAYGAFTVTNDITKYTKAKIFSEIGKKPELFTRFSTVAGERGAADHWNHREDDDYYSQPGKLFQLMSPEEQQALFGNTA